MKFCVFYYISFFFFFYSICVCACVELQDSQVRDVWSIQRGQHAPSSQKAVLHDGKTLQQLLPVNQSPRYSPFTSGCVCACVCLGGSTTVFQIQRSPPRLHSWLGVRTHIKTRCQTTGLIYPRGLIQFVCKSFVLFARLPDYVERKIAKKNKKKKTPTTAHLLIGCSPETWPLIRCSSGCRRRDSSWKTKFSSSWLGTCQHTPKAATSPALPQSWKDESEWETEREKEDFLRKFFPLEQRASHQSIWTPPPQVLCYLLVFKHSKLEIHYQIAD